MFRREFFTVFFFIFSGKIVPVGVHKRKRNKPLTNFETRAKYFADDFLRENLIVFSCKLFLWFRDLKRSRKCEIVKEVFKYFKWGGRNAEDGKPNYWNYLRIIETEVLNMSLLVILCFIKFFLNWLEFLIQANLWKTWNQMKIPSQNCNMLSKSVC